MLIFFFLLSNLITTFFLHTLLENLRFLKRRLTVRLDTLTFLSSLNLAVISTNGALLSVFTIFSNCRLSLSSMAGGLPDLGRFSTVPASLNFLIMSDIVDLGCCNTLAMSDIFSPFYSKSTATFFKSGDISFPFHPMIFGIQKHTQTRSRRHCHVRSDVTKHYFIYRNHGFALAL
jgi:hypothetical protein